LYREVAAVAMISDVLHHSLAGDIMFQLPLGHVTSAESARFLLLWFVYFLQNMGEWYEEI